MKSFFWKKYEQAVLNNEAIQLDEIVNSYCKNDKRKETPQRSKPESFDLIFKLQYDEKGNKIFVCNKDFGCIEAGRTVGRFTTKWEKGRKYLKDIVLNSKERGILCDLEYIPRRLRMGNVISSMSICDYSLSFYTPNNDKNVISLMDVYVGIHRGRFYLKSKSLGKIIRVRTNNLLFFYGDSPIIRFIKEIQYDGIVRWETSMFKNISVLPHFPEIRYKSVIIRPETWIIKKSDVSDDNFSKFEIDFCEKFSPQICRYVSLNYGDNDLLIDTHIEYFRRMIYLQLKKDGEVILKKAYDLYSVDQQVYSSEIVLSFFKREHNNMLNVNKDNYIAIENNWQRIKQVGSEWLHIKVYGYDDEDEYLINTLFSFVSCLKSKGIIDSFFFVRYADPYKHLRIRLHNGDNNIIESLNIVLNELLTNVNNHVISHYELAPYDREVERYGGLEGMEIAEQIFELDSIISIYILKENMSESLLEGLFIVSSVHYMKFFGWNFQRQSEWLEQRIDRTKFKKEWKSVRQRYIELFFNYKNCFSVNIDEILLKKQELLNYYKMVCNNDVLLQETVMSGVLHMSFNRLFGMDGIRENKLLIYTRNLAYNLQKRGEHLGTDT